MARPLEQWVGHYQAGKSDKVWAAAYYDDGYYEAAWGKRGKDLSRQGHQLSSSEASELYSKKVRDKQREGYVQAEFDRDYYGVASFPARGDRTDTIPVPVPANRPNRDVLPTARINPAPSAYPVPVVRPTQSVETERQCQGAGSSSRHWNNRLYARRTRRTVTYRVGE
jgi:predicted DNA-binding WGR domain protein